MDHYDFDQVIDRRNTNSLKYDFAPERGRPADVLPLWVADMDFQAPPPVLEALRQAVDHGIFGYSEAKEDYAQAVIGWFARRFGWQPQPEWLVKTPGVVFALATAIRALTQPGDRVLIQPPVYYPFANVIRSNGRVVVENRLVYQGGKYTIDFADLEEKIRTEEVKVLLLCSPHNPVGRVWTLPELQQLGAICQKHHVFVISDEIHCDFAFPGHPHHVFPLANPALLEQTMVCTSPSKSFNLAGLQVSNIWIPGQAPRKAFLAELNRQGYLQINKLGLVACQAAYTGGAPWLDQCRAYLRDNLDFLRRFLAQRLPQLRLVEPQGTYFAWLDCSALGLDAKALSQLILHRAKLWLDDGRLFGGGADQFQRIVLACPRSTLAQALEQLAQAVQGLDRP